MLSHTKAVVGMSVMVDMAGFSRYGISIGQGPAVSGTVVTFGPAGITVKLADVLEGLDTVTIEPDRVTSV